MGAIGIFDSGVGGITVLRELKQRWPHQDFLYLADTARLPYGSKSLLTIRNYVEQNFRFLLQHKLKAIIVACNSASTAMLEDPVPCPLPVFNVVEPGARRAVAASINGRIGVLGTRATVVSEAYPHVIRRLKKDAEVYQQHCPLFVPLVEEGWLDDPITNLIVYRYVTELMQKQVDTVILGCTHYPALRNAIRKVTGNGVALVDSAMGLIEELIAAKVCEGDSVPTPEHHGRLDILCTDFSPHMIETFRLLLGGIDFDSLETVSL